MLSGIAKPRCVAFLSLLKTKGYIGAQSIDTTDAKDVFTNSKDRNRYEKSSYCCDICVSAAVFVDFLNVPFKAVVCLNMHVL